MACEVLAGPRVGTKNHIFMSAHISELPGLNNNFLADYSCPTAGFCDY